MAGGQNEEEGLIGQLVTMRLQPIIDNLSNANSARTRINSYHFRQPEVAIINPGLRKPITATPN